jgi:hypothetical protein
MPCPSWAGLWTFKKAGNVRILYLAFVVLIMIYASSQASFVEETPQPTDSAGTTQDFPDKV